MGTPDKKSMITTRMVLSVRKVGCMENKDFKKNRIAYTLFRIVDTQINFYKESW